MDGEVAISLEVQLQMGALLGVKNQWPFDAEIADCNGAVAIADGAESGAGRTGKRHLDKASRRK